ncbi:MAG: putative membrane protein YfcA [Kiritimatiellia bacterium]|jgi:uncharacterized membrane protein YfcA
MELTLSYDIIALLFFVALIAGVIDTLAGGGGLIVLPTLLILQIPPLQALATNKLQGSFGTFTASLTLLHKKALHWKSIRIAFVASLIGSAIGTIAVHFIDTSLLEWLIPIVLISIAGYFLMAKNNPHTKNKTPTSQRRYLLGIVPCIGFYDGFLGPGTGSFFTVAHVVLMKQTIIEATVNAKLLNFSSNIASLLLFIASGQVLWIIGGVMIAGQIIGASIGSRLILAKGAIIIRPLIVITCLSMCTYFIWNKIAYAF